MEQLTGLDASFLNLETPTNFGHVASLVILDWSGQGCEPFPAIRELVASRLHTFPGFRRKVIDVPFGIDHPYWVDDDAFDLDWHLRRVQVPAPGGDEELAEVIADISARPMDRRRPLWEMYVIEGIAGGRVGWIDKIHHAAIDGVSGAELLDNLMDRSPEPGENPPAPKPWQPERPPTPADIFAASMLGVGRIPTRLVRMQVRLLRELSQQVTGGNAPDLPFVRRLGRVGRDDVPDARRARPPVLRAPRTSFNHQITSRRRYAFRSMPLADIKELKTAFGCTINDIVLALCAGGLRRYLDKRGELPTSPLVAMVPVSVRTSGEPGAYGNRVSALSAPLPVQLADPLDRVRTVSVAMTALKEQHQAMGADLLTQMSEMVVPGLATRAARVAFRARLADRLAPMFNLVVSNVPGPQHPLYLAGAPMLGYFPISALVDGQGLNITVQSYNGGLDWGLIGDRELVPDIWEIIGHLEDELAELQEIARSGAAAVPAGIPG